VAAPEQTIDNSSSFIYFSSLIGRPVYEQKSGRFLGRLTDLAARLEEMYPRVRELVATRGHRDSFAFPWDCVLGIDAKGIQVRFNGNQPAPYQPREGEILLRDDFLDQQIVDISGCKIVRVNDLHLLRANESLWLVHIDVGTRGLLRRLGFEGIVAPLVRWLFGYDFPDKFISWKYVQPLPTQSRTNHGMMKLTIPQRKLSELHPADLADILEELNARERQAVLNALPVETAAGALENAEPEVQKAVIEEFHEEKAADILEEMSPTEAADILGDLTDEKAENILDAMEPKQAEDVRELLEHSEESAGGLMTTAYLALPPETTVAATIDRLRARAEELDVFSYVYVVAPDEHLLGVVSLRGLLCARPASTLREIATTKVVSVSPDLSHKEVARLFAKYGFRGVPVVTADGKLAGVIRFRNVVEAVAPFLES
jgi:magnesium transporter